MIGQGWDVQKDMDVKETWFLVLEVMGRDSGKRGTGNS